MKKNVVLFIIVSLMFFYINDFEIFKETVGFLHEKEYIKAIIYLITFLSGIVGFYLILFNKFLRIPFLVLFIVTSVMDIGYRNLSPLGFRYDDALLILQEWNDKIAGEALSVYGHSFLLPFIIVNVMAIVLYIIFSKKELKFSAIIGLFFISISFFMSYKILTISNGVRVAYPSFIKIPTIIYYAMTHKLYVGKREKVSIPIVKKPLFKHIIYIVDESVRGDKLSLNGFDKNTTPFLVSIKNNIFNYGIASSGGICSSYSNGILISGLQISQLPDKNNISRKNPLIFDYAKNAGFITSMFDMQNSRKKPNNFMQINSIQNDIKNIDYTFFYGEDVKTQHKIYEKDLVGIKKLHQYLQKHKNQFTFTYFVKQGSHFSYIDKYPKNQTIFKPVLENSGWGEWDNKIKNRFLNTYYNSIRWEVDNFFKVFLRTFKQDNVLIIYTSDHAQNLIDDLSIKQTHCAKGSAPSVMAEVPLFVIPTSDKYFNIYKNLFIKSNINHLSHFNIFPSILVLMGYDKEDVNKKYGKTIFDDLSKQKRIFTSGDIFGRSKMYKNKFKENN